MAKNLVQMSVAGTLYDIRDQRITTKLDYVQASLTLAIEHKQDVATAVVTNEASVNYIGRLTAGATNSVVRNKDDYADIITGTQDAYVHSLWFSMGPISYEQKDKENRELEQLRAWSKSFGVEFQSLSKKPRILGLNAKDQKTEVDIYGKSLHTEYIDSALGINYIKPEIVKTLKHDIVNLPQSIRGIDCSRWAYYGKRDNESGAKPTFSNDNTIGYESAITNIALWDFFQKEGSDYYRVLSEERIANKQIDKNLAAQNAYKIVTLDENGTIPNIFLSNLKLDNLGVGNVELIDKNTQFIIKNKSVAGDNFVIAFQPSDTDDNTTKLTQNTISTKNITAGNVTVSNKIKAKTLEVTGSANITEALSADSISVTNDISANNVTVANKTKTKALEVDENATVTGKVSAGSTEITNGLSAGSISTEGEVSAGSAEITGTVSADNAIIANLITDIAVSSTKAVGYDDTGKLIPINGVADNATNITSILTGLSAANTDTSSIYYKLMKLIYPVGSLYWSSKSTNPASLFGGTWVQIKDKFVLACGDTYTSSGATGGASSVTLSVSNMPSHTHSFTPSGTISMNAHSHGLNNHTHSFTPSGTVSSHSHEYTPSGSVSGFVLGIVARWKGYDDPDLNYPDSGVTTTRKQNGGDFGGGGGQGGHYDRIEYNPNFNGTKQSTGFVSPTFTGSQGTTDGNSGNTTSTISTGSFTGSAGTTSSNGSGTSFSILPPYVVKYCFERTA